MLIAIVALVFTYRIDSGVFSFDYFDLLHTSFGSDNGFWLMLGFLLPSL